METSAHRSFAHHHKSDVPPQHGGADTSSKPPPPAAGSMALGSLAMTAASLPLYFPPQRCGGATRERGRRGGPGTPSGPPVSLSLSFPLRDNEITAFPGEAARPGWSRSPPAASLRQLASAPERLRLPLK